MFRCTGGLATAAALVAALASSALAQSARSQIDAGHSYATLWLGRQTETSPMVNVGVAQVGGSVKLTAQDPATSTLEFCLVPGGAGAELLAPDGTLRRDVSARLMRYSTMTFRTTGARVRRDGRLEFSGELTLTHVTREEIPVNWNSTNNGYSYTDPETTRVTRKATFVLATPRAEFLAPYLKEHSDLLATANIEAVDFPELGRDVLDSYWPTVAEDEECEPVNQTINVRDYGGWNCKGKAITTTSSLQPTQTSSLDYSGLRKYDAPVHGPVTILLRLKLVQPVPPPAAK